MAKREAVIRSQHHVPWPLLIVRGAASLLWSAQLSLRASERGVEEGSSDESASILE